MTRSGSATGLIEIASRELAATINPYGAELSSLRDAAGREFMTDADPAFWTGRAPILFPIVGRVTDDVIRVDGVQYPMPKHGFARRSSFVLVAQEANRARFRLVDDPRTWAHYPFHFLLEVDFAIVGAALTMIARIGNDGAVLMPASFGWHPAFAWPLPYGAARSDHRIVFETDEPGAIRVLTDAGYVAPDQRATPVEQRTLDLRDTLFTEDALIWDRIASQRLRYGAGSGPSLDIAFPDTPMLGIWTKPGAQYVCIEPWHGIADPEGYAGEFADKPGVFVLAPGERREMMLQVALAA